MGRFYGYGELTADYWFVGMEQGGDSCYKRTFIRAILTEETKWTSHK
jgi:hypothetical protein